MIDLKQESWGKTRIENPDSQPGSKIQFGHTDLLNLDPEAMFA